MIHNADDTSQKRRRGGWKGCDWKSAELSIVDSHNHSYSNDHPLNGIVSLHVFLDKIFGKDKYTCFPRNVPFEEIFRKRTLSGTH